MKKKQKKASVTTTEHNSQINADLFHWFSTYGRLTVERLLEIFQLKIDTDDLSLALKNHYSFYYKLLRVPFNNILNGLIYDQAYEYQVYAQKIFIDYLLSGQNDLDENTPGAYIREKLQDERAKLVAMVDLFAAQKTAYRKLIAECQNKLITITKNFNNNIDKATTDSLFHAEGINKDLSRRAINALLMYQDENNLIQEKGWKQLNSLININLTDDIKQQFLTIIEPLLPFTERLVQISEDFNERAMSMGALFKRYRTDFYQLIIRTTELLQNLPEYTHDEDQEAKNRELLYFDRNILE